MSPMDAIEVVITATTNNKRTDKLISVNFGNILSADTTLSFLIRKEKPVTSDLEIMAGIKISKGYFLIVSIENKKAFMIENRFISFPPPPII
jgi:hypothetical protein